MRSVLYLTMLEQVANESPDELEALMSERLPRLVKAADESPDAYAVESFLLNFATVDLCSNRLLVDILQSISLRTLRYLRLSMVADPQSIRVSLKRWRALHKVIVGRDNETLLSLAAQRLDEARDAAVLAIAPVSATRRVARAGKSQKASLN